MDESRISPSADPLADVAPEQRNAFDGERIERAVREILVAIGEDPDRDGLRDTPKRVARAYEELFSGLYQKPEDVLATTFDLNHHELIVVKDISVFSVCEHHLLPFYGTASVGYIPNESGRITGLSKLARLVDVYAKRPQVQERLTSQIADSMMRILEPRGVIVSIECEHMCMSMRGVEKQSAKTLTTATRGILDESELKQLTLKFVSRD
jgi:GTP cyclohydrolase IA